MSEHPAGLWPAPGDGVLARRGNLVILTSAESAEMVDRLLDILEQLAATGGDGRQFADVVAEVIEAHSAGLTADQSPSVLAFGPAGQGIALAVCGTAWAEVSTAYGAARLEAVQPGMLLRCLLTSQVSGVLGGLGLGGEVTARTDRFSRLDAGTVRASGLGYYVAGASAGPGDPAVQVASAQAAPAKPVSVEEGPAEPVSVEEGTAEPESAEPAPDEPVSVEPGPAEPVSVEEGPERSDSLSVPSVSAVPSIPAGQGAASGAPVATELWSLPVDQGAGDVQPGMGGLAGSDHENTIFPGAEPFDAVVLTGAGPGNEVDVEPRDPLPMASDVPLETPSFASEAPIIQGVYCANGHFDDPEALVCAVCGIPMNPQSMVPMAGPRPPLGVLVLDDGSVFQLDSDYVVGREPGLDASVASGSSRPLRVADDSGIVSRVHAKVQLDGWKVTVTDLGSANGTRIKLPHNGTEQVLVPHVPAVLETGSQVDLGGRELRYESHRAK